MSRAPRRLTIPCSRCGRAAAEIALLPADPQGAGWEARRDRIERTDFMGRLIKFGEPGTLHEFFERLARRDFASVRGADADFVAFHCRACDKVYCERCWQIGPPVFDEGFYDCTFGACPEQHEQVVDD
jgi:hypothetical protein